MYFFRVIFIASMLLLGMAHADELEEIEITFREHPTKLYLSVTDDLPQSLIFSSVEQFTSRALELGYSPEQLMSKLILLTRLNMDIQIRAPGKLEQAQQLIEQLKTVARSNYEKAALNNLEARYIGRVQQAYQQTVTLNNQALELLSEARTNAANCSNMSFMKTLA